MAEEKAKRARRTVEDKIAEIDAKIATLEAKKQELLRPAKMKKIIEEASANMTPEEMAEKLGIKLGPSRPAERRGFTFTVPALQILQTGSLADQAIPSSPLWQRQTSVVILLIVLLLPHGWYAREESNPQP